METICVTIFFSDALWEKSFPGDSLIIYTLNITDEFLNLD